MRSLADGVQAEVADDTYIEAVAQIKDEADSRIGDALDAVTATAEGRTLDSLLPELSEEGGTTGGPGPLPSLGSAWEIRG